MNPRNIQFPRKVESLPQFSAIKNLWHSQTQPLWPGGRMTLPLLKADDNIWTCLKLALVARHLLQGTDLIERKLKSEQKGINESQATKYSHGSRMSRLMILFPGGSERFYRTNEKILDEYQHRLAGIMLDASVEELSKKLFGKEGKHTRVIMIDDKEILVKFLSSLV